MVSISEWYCMCFYFFTMAVCLVAPHIVGHKAVRRLWIKAHRKKNPGLSDFGMTELFYDEGTAAMVTVHGAIIFLINVPVVLLFQDYITQCS